MTAPPIPVVFIHGLWIHSDAWQPWVELYRSAGYDAIAPGWPGDSASVDKFLSQAGLDMRRCRTW
jgi:non-heme chloroperoxidase